MANTYDSYRSPPLMTDEKTYADWKKEAEIRQLATDIKVEKQAASIFLTLTGRAREVVYIRNVDSGHRRYRGCK